MTAAFVASTLHMIALGGLTMAVVTDIQSRIILDRVVLLVGVCGVLLRLLSPGDPIWPSFAALILVFLGLWGVFAVGAIGGGDVKMISAATLMVPAGQVVSLLLSIALAGGVLACLYLSARYVLVRTGGGTPVAESPDAQVLHDGWFRSTMRRECARIAAGEPMPYALAILAGVAAQLLKGIS